MASIGSQDLQENIVGPLMDMMGRLSEEMRKNLVHEVSNIVRKVDALSSKVDHLITIVEGNAGNHMFVSETRALKTKTVQHTHHRENGNDCSSLNSSYDEHGENKIVSEIVDYDKKSLENHLQTRKTHVEISENDIDDFSAQANLNMVNTRREKNNESILENGNDSVPNGPTNTNSIEKLYEKKEPSTFGKDDDYSKGVDKSESDDDVDDDDDENNDNDYQAELEKKPELEANNTPTLQRGLEAEAKSIMNAENECPENGGIPSPNESFSDSQRNKTERRMVNFGLRELPKRPESHVPTSDIKANISYANFKKSRTEFTQDNRAVYLKDAFNIMENGTDPSSADIDNRSPKKVVQRKNGGIERSEHFSKGHNKAGRGNDDEAGCYGNNQASASGLHNEHGFEDNRFNAAAHDDVNPVSMTRRPHDLSNQNFIKNGPKPATEPTDQPKPKDPEPELVSDDVLHSLIEKERLSASDCKDVKSNGIDTVICLDTSSSMAGKPLTTSIACIEKILDGFETNAVYHGLEENVALVTFGNENKIRHHLTNDYFEIREGLADIKAGGPSPLWLGLALSVSEIKERGGACVMEPTTVLPRIILITDGYASRKNCLNGDDNGQVDDQVLGELVSLVETCASFTSYMECIKTGRCNEDFMKILSNGRMYTTEDTESITEFFKIQEKANSIIKQVKGNEIDVAEIDTAIENSKLNDKGKEDLREILSASLPSNDEQPSKSDTELPNEEVETEPQSKSEQADQPANGVDVSLPPESLDDVKAPSFGTAVLPTPEWPGFASRPNLIGTVVGIRKKGLLKIMWSDGITEKCKYGVEGQYDIKVSPDQSIDCDKIHTGSLVVRGKDWRWKDQDGGEGSVGVVTKIDGLVVHVIWSHGGIGNYRYGYNKKYDLALRDYRTEKHFVWYIEEESDQWEMFPKDVNERIEQMFTSKHTGTFLVNSETKSLRIAIQNMQARDTTNTQKAYNIERRELSEEEFLAVSNEQ